MLRPALGSTFALVLAALAAALATDVHAGVQPSESFSVEDGRGIVTIRGSGVVIGRLDRGEVEITDLSPFDQWSPRVNGVPRGRLVWTRGKSVNFYVPGGRFRILVKGEGISISARGQGVAIIDGRPDPVGDAGMYTVGDDDGQPVPDDVQRVVFGSPVSTKATP